MTAAAQMLIEAGVPTTSLILGQLWLWRKHGRGLRRLGSGDAAPGGLTAKLESIHKEMKDQLHQYGIKPSSERR